MTEFSTKKYNGIELITLDVDVLEQIEKIVGKPLSEVEMINRETTGFVTKDKRIAELGIYKKDLTKLPDNFGKLENLEKLVVRNNQLAS
ncbi:MAG: hypothetical protein GPJ52_06665, partial [Candidatus Heimdallarchaeota archaeon]|nr:hypothetical protein [Candidatus Heimdallarchaeota archaeon]